MTTKLTIEMATPEQVDEGWADIEPILDASCKSNDIGSMDITPDDIRQLAQAGMCVLFLGRDNGKVKVVIAIQFNDTNGHKGADVIAMGGERLMQFKNAYWNLILDWLKVNGCEFLDAYANDRLAKIYTSKFGFDRACHLVRMAL